MPAPLKYGFCFLLLLAGCTFTPSISASRYKLFIPSEGLYRVTGAMLRNAGMDVDKIDPTTVQLFHGNREVAIRVSGEKENLGLEFYGEASDTMYSPFSVYWMQWGVEKGKRMPELRLAAPAGSPKESFEDAVRISQPTLYIPQTVEASESWFWQSLTAPITSTIPITLLSAMPVQARLRVSLLGITEDSVTPNHHIRVLFNNARVADETWAGTGEHPIDAMIPASDVRLGVNSVQLIAPGDTRAQADIVLLSSITVTYTRQFIANATQDSLEFPGSAGTFHVQGFSGDAVDLYDVIDPSQPAHASNVAGLSHGIAFSDNSGSPRHWLAVGPAGFKSPARIAPITSSDLQAATQRADYIVITYPEFIDALKLLVQWREKQGLKVSVVTTDEIYDEFNYGAESPLAIRAFIDWAYHHWAQPAPRFVLLVGKASYDYLDYLKGPNKNLVPTFLVHTQNLGQAASDNWFVALDGKTDRPALAIGRIPAKTADQVAHVVSKTITFESAQSGDWRRRALFVADDKDPEFNTMADALAVQMPGMQVEKAYLSSHQGDVSATRAQMLQDWNSGVSVITYVGHGSINTWAAGPLFSTDYLNEIKNGDHLPVLFTPTCLDGFFYHPQVDSLAEDLLFKADGGIVAGLVPTGLSFPEPQKELMHALFAKLYGDSGITLGEAVMAAKQELQGDSPDVREVIDTFGLLGDPALEFNKGE